MQYFGKLTGKVAGLIVGLSLLSGCAEHQTGYSYGMEEAGREQTVRYGAITRIDMVKIGGSKSGLGALSGAAVGGVAGSSIGQGNGSALGAIGGAIVGGLAGDAVEGSTTSAEGVNLFIKLCSGKVVSIIQPLDAKNPLRVRDSVVLLSNGRTTRVTYDPDKTCSD